MGIKKAIGYIFAENEDFSLENRLFLSALLIGLLITLLGIIVATVLITQSTTVIIGLILWALLVIVYFFVRFKGISVSDNGIGMAPDVAGNLFKLDFRTKRPGTEGELSTGLGLFLCKDFIEKHRGKIWVESEPGKGSAFSFTVPASVNE